MCLDCLKKPRGGPGQASPPWLCVINAQSDSDVLRGGLGPTYVLIKSPLVILMGSHGRRTSLIPRKSVFLRSVSMGLKHSLGLKAWGFACPTRPKTQDGFGVIAFS